MADINFVVDTNPMADSISGVSNHVTATTAAVVAMQAAVIASEKQSANRICQNVDKGFYSLIRSQLTMKLSDAYTEMQAKLALLTEYSKTLQKTQARMEGDYFRVRRQYQQIFKGLDKALSTRVAQLDKEAVGIADARKKMILGMFERHVPEALVTSAEVDSSNQQIAAARIKDKTGRSLDNLAGKVAENQSYRQLMDAMLDKNTSETVQQEYISVVFSSKQSSVVTDSYVMTLNFPEYLPEQISSNISLNILSHEELFAGDGKTDFEKKTVSEEFQALVASSGLDQRVADQIMRLFREGGC